MGFKSFRIVKLSGYKHPFTFFKKNSFVIIITCLFKDMIQTYHFE